MADAAVTARTDPVGRYVALHEAFAANGGGRAPGWLREARAGAFARFAELGFPTVRMEDWRFTSVEPIAATAFGAAMPADAPAALVAPDRLTAGPRLVFVNGRLATGRSSLAGLPDGVRVESLSTALRGRDAGFLERYLAAGGATEANPFAALNTAFLDDGALVHVGRGVDLDAPIELLFVAVAATPAVTHPRCLVVVEEGARVSVVERYRGAGAVYWTNAVTEVVLGDGAHLELTRLQQEASGAYHVASTRTRQGRGAVLRLHPMVFGAALARHDITNVLDGAGAELVLNGLYLLGGRQHADHHTVIDHAQPDCQSHEFFNGVLDGRSRGVFNGRIVVRPGAQRTDSKQTNHNLVLSEEARADSQPQLEIYADDVKCTHGATLGPLDPKELFYLQTRGLAPAEARALLTYGFGGEILGRVRHAGVRAALDALVQARLAAGHVAEAGTGPGATL